MITVRFFAAARDAAGGGVVSLPGRWTAATLRAELTARYGDRMAAVVDVSTLLCDGERLDGAAAIDDGAVVDVLPPFAGG